MGLAALISKKSGKESMRMLRILAFFVPVRLDKPAAGINFVDPCGGSLTKKSMQALRAFAFFVSVRLDKPAVFGTSCADPCGGSLTKKSMQALRALHFLFPSA
jgi:hypothetical protein